MEIPRRDPQLTVVRLAPGLDDLAPAPTGEPAVQLIYARTGGVVVDHEGEVAVLHDGALLVARERGVLRTRVEAGASAIAVRITNSSAGPYFGAIDGARGRVLSTRDGSASIVAHLLDGIARQSGGRAASYEGRLAQHLAGLVALVCTDAGERGTREELLQRAKDYIEANLSDVDLSPRRVARAQNISTRTLHRLFESDRQTISGWIRNRRLEQSRLEILMSARDVAIGTIASRWGMWDAARFSRLFKAAYGMSPRAYRAAAMATAMGRDGEVSA